MAYRQYADKQALLAGIVASGLALLIVGRRGPGMRMDAAFVKRAAVHCTTLLIEGLRAR